MAAKTFDQLTKTREHPEPPHRLTVMKSDDDRQIGRAHV